MVAVAICANTSSNDSVHYSSARHPDGSTLASLPAVSRAIAITMRVVPLLVTTHWSIRLVLNYSHFLQAS
jgi:hypothetical protein